MNGNITLPNEGAVAEAMLMVLLDFIMQVREQIPETAEHPFQWVVLPAEDYELAPFQADGCLTVLWVVGYLVQWEVGGGSEYGAIFWNPATGQVGLDPDAMFNGMVFSPN